MECEDQEEGRTEEEAESWRGTLPKTKEKTGLHDHKKDLQVSKNPLTS